MRQAAQRAGISLTSWSNYETGRRQLQRVPVALCIAQALDNRIPVEALLGLSVANSRAKPPTLVEMAAHYASLAARCASLAAQYTREAVAVERAATSRLVADHHVLAVSHG